MFCQSRSGYHTSSCGVLAHFSSVPLFFSQSVCPCALFIMSCSRSVGLPPRVLYEISRHNPLQHAMMMFLVLTHQTNARREPRKVANKVFLRGQEYFGGVVAATILCNGKSTTPLKQEEEEQQRIIFETGIVLSSSSWRTRRKKPK